MSETSSCHSMYFQKEASLLLHDVLCSKCKILDQNYVKCRPEYIFFRKSYNLRRAKPKPNFQTRKSKRILEKLESFYQARTKRSLPYTVNETKSYKHIKNRKMCKKNFNALTSSVTISEHCDVSMHYSKDFFLSLFNLKPCNKSLTESNLTLSDELCDTFIPSKEILCSLSADANHSLETLENFDFSSIMCREYLKNCPHIGNDVNALDDDCKWIDIEKHLPVSWPCTFIKMHSHTHWSHSYKFKKIEIFKFLRNLQLRKPLNQLDLTKTPVLRLNRVLQDISLNISFVCLNDLITKTVCSDESNIDEFEKLNSHSEADDVLCITPPITPIYSD